MSSSVPLGSHDTSATSGPGSDDSNQSKQLSIFCREVRNLLRSKQNCMIPFSKFVPAYHNHYGRQCCVYQYGFTKLIELLEAIPHVVQIVGEGTNRYITLTHREQIKRFASDLIKVVKAQPGKRLRMSQMPRAYEALLGRTFRVQDYGTQNLQELLNEIWEGTINIVRGDPRKRHLKEAANSLINSNNNNNSINKSNNNKHYNNSYNSNATNNNGHHHHHHSQGHHNSKRRSPHRRHRDHHVTDENLEASEEANDDYGDDEDQSAADASADDVDHNNANGTVTGSNGGVCNAITMGKIIDQETMNALLADDDTWFEIPKRERSDKEIKRTKYFIWDVIKLLSTMPPHYSVPFSKFIPSYHHYYNRQCKVSVYGFSKLIDLFESISPDIVEIVDCGPCEEKVIKLASCHVPKPHQDSHHHHHHHHPQQQQQPHHNHYHHHHKSSNNTCNNYRKGGNQHGKTTSNIISANNNNNTSLNNNNNNNNNINIGIKNNSISPTIAEGNIISSIKTSNNILKNGCNDLRMEKRSVEDEVDDSVIDRGPTEEELFELEEELEAYQQYEATKGKRSNRMAALLPFGVAFKMTEQSYI